MSTISQAVPWSDDGSDVIGRDIEIDESSIGLTNPEDTFALHKVCQLIEENEFKRIALQLPDELLHLAYEIAKTINENILGNCFVLADTSFGSCCVDEVAAEHYFADCIVHFGHSCLSKPSRIPTILVFGSGLIHHDDFISYLRSNFEADQKLLIFCHTDYYNDLVKNFDQIQHIFPAAILPMIPDGLEVLRPHKEGQPLKRTCCGGDICMSEDNKDDEDVDHQDAAIQPKSEVNPDFISLFGRNVPNDVDLEDGYQAIFIGPHGNTLSNMMLRLNKIQFHSFDPATKRGQRESLNVNRALMKRYFLVQKVRDASVIGIIAGTLAVAQYKEIIQNIKRLARLCNKKYYLFLMGKLNDAKMANFSEIEAFVLVSCCETSVLDNHDLFAPVVTPFEFELACSPTKEWTGQYETEFQQLLPDFEADIQSLAIVGDDEEAEPQFSLLTQSYKSVQHDTSNSDMSLVPSANSGELLPYGGKLLNQRSWTGLEQKLGETPVEKAKKGRKGIAIEYENEIEE